VHARTFCQHVVAHALIRADKRQRELFIAQSTDYA
jgi:hypothetical protein